MLSESAFISLPHILEAETDLECSIDLSITHYYKQAVQLSRAFLEGQVVDLDLAFDQEAFARWKKRLDRGVKNLGGENGLLSKLERSGVLDVALSKRIRTVYKELNAAIHGAEPTLINDGLFVGRHTGRAFRPDKLTSWSRQLSEVVDIAIHLMKYKTEIWLRGLRSQSTMCSVCRENSTENIGGFSFGGKEFVKFRCKLCLDETTRDKRSGELVFVVSRTQRGSLDEAIAVYRATLVSKPEDLETLSDLAGALAEKGIWDEALAIYRRAVDLRPDFNNLFGLGNALLVNQLWDEAIVSLRRVLKIKPDALAFNSLAVALMEKRQIDEAVFNFRRSLELEPDDPYTLANLGVCPSIQPWTADLD